MLPDNLINFFKSFSAIPELAEEEISKKIVYLQVDKKSHILRSGQISNYLYYIEQGVVRYYIEQDEKDVTTDISIEGEMATSFASFISKKPSLENIEVLEDAVLWGIHYDDLQDLYHKFPEMNTVGRLIIEKYYTSLVEHTYMMKYGNAFQRYEYLMKRKPQLIQKVPLGVIASYLGMTLETLSRVRKKYQGS